MLNFRSLSTTTGVLVYYSVKARLDRGHQLFGQSWPIFGVYQNLFAASVPSIAICLTAFFGSTYLCKDSFSQTKIIKSRY
jgi:hypothetical protein